METCTNRCSLNVIDEISGIDYHMWLNKNPNGNNIKITINTSIQHPKHLKYNKNISPTIIVDKYGDVFTKNI